MGPLTVSSGFCVSTKHVDMVEELAGRASLPPNRTPLHVDACNTYYSPKKALMEMVLLYGHGECRHAVDSVNIIPLLFIGEKL